MRNNVYLAIYIRDIQFQLTMYVSFAKVKVICRHNMTFIIDLYEIEPLFVAYVPQGNISTGISSN